MSNPFAWQQKASIFATDPKFVHRSQGGSGMPAKTAPLRNSTSSINTEPPKIERTKGAAI